MAGGLGAFWRGFLLLAGAGAIWGTIGVASKLLADETGLGMLAVAWLRAAVASPIVVGLGLATLGRRLLWADRRALAGMALLGVVLLAYQWLYLLAVERLGVAAATLVALCVPPVLVAAASVAWLGEPPTARLLLAVGGALVGTALLVGRPTAAGAGGEAALGVLVALGSAVGIATHVLASRRLAARQPALRPLAVGFPAGAAALLPVAAADLRFDLGAEGWLLVLYLAAVPSVVAYWMYQRGLRDVPATAASVVTLLEPVVAAALAWVLFGERLGPLGLLGGALLLGAIGLLSLGAGGAAAAAADR